MLRRRVELLWPDRDVREKLGYTDDEVAAVPDGADLGLGCGNPQDAGFERVRVSVQPQSRALVEDWSPGTGPTRSWRRR
jgi:hypothetical protein